MPPPSTKYPKVVWNFEHCLRVYDPQVPTETYIQPIYQRNNQELPFYHSQRHRDLRKTEPQSLTQGNLELLSIRLQEDDALQQLTDTYPDSLPGSLDYVSTRGQDGSLDGDNFVPQILDHSNYSDHTTFNPFPLTPVTLGPSTSIIQPDISEYTIEYESDDSTIDETYFPQLLLSDAPHDTDSTSNITGQEDYYPQLRYSPLLDRTVTYCYDTSLLDEHGGYASSKVDHHSDYDSAPFDHIHQGHSRTTSKRASFRGQPLSSQQYLRDRTPSDCELSDCYQDLPSPIQGDCPSPNFRTPNYIFSDSQDPRYSSSNSKSLLPVDSDRSSPDYCHLPQSRGDSCVDSLEPGYQGLERIYPDLSDTTDNRALVLRPKQSLPLPNNQQDQRKTGQKRRWSPGLESERIRGRCPSGIKSVSLPILFCSHRC